MIHSVRVIEAVLVLMEVERLVRVTVPGLTRSRKVGQCAIKPAALTRMFW